MRRVRWVVAAGLALGCGAAGAQQQVASRVGGWTGSWASAQQAPEPENAMKDEDLRDVTLRQVVRLSVGGARLRVHVSNAFGRQPLQLDAVFVARPAGGSRVASETERAVTFAGRREVTVPAGAEYVSDAVEMDVKALGSVAVSLHVAAPPAGQTGHMGARATSWFVHGAHTGAPGLEGAGKMEHWFFLSGIDVEGGGRAVACLGDSITDGHGATTDGNDRWTDVMAAALPGVGVLNEGIGGNHLLTDGLGPNALARLDRDVLGQAGVKTVIVLEGINDLGGLSRVGEVPAQEHAALVARMIGAYEQVVYRAHARGLRVIGGTLSPFVGSDYYHPAAANEADRAAVNAWIRGLGHFDGVIDFDRLLRDPAHAERLLGVYDSGDHLHPSAAGYRVMGQAAAAAVREP